MSNAKAMSGLYRLIRRFKTSEAETLSRGYVIEQLEALWNELGGNKISNQQMAFFHAVIVPMFAEYTGDSKDYTEKLLKVKCGWKWFEPETIEVRGIELAVIPTKTRLSTKDFMEWYENIVSFGLELGVIVPPPDPTWRNNDNVCLH